MAIQDRISEVVELFSKTDDWEEKYKILIKLGKNLPELAEEYKTDSNLIRGCQSQVWLQANFDNKNIEFLSDSDAAITKGIVALLVKIYSGATPDEIINTQPTFLEDIGIRDHLSMNRANGLAAMIKQISIYGMAFKAKSNMS